MKNLLCARNKMHSAEPMAAGHVEKEALGILSVLPPCSVTLLPQPDPPTSQPVREQHSG